MDLFSGSGASGSGGVRSCGRLMTVLLVDEIDMLMTRDQSVLYNVFSWPHLPGARLAVIGIANTLDLPQRLLPKIARCPPEPARHVIPPRTVSPWQSRAPSVGFDQTPGTMYGR